jgi:hypothetical protein
MISTQPNKKLNHHISVNMDAYILSNLDHEPNTSLLESIDHPKQNHQYAFIILSRSTFFNQFVFV